MYSLTKQIMYGEKNLFMILICDLLYYVSESGLWFFGNKDILLYHFDSEPILQSVK